MLSPVSVRPPGAFSFIELGLSTAWWQGSVRERGAGERGKGLAALLGVGWTNKILERERLDKTTSVVWSEPMVSVVCPQNLDKMVSLAC